VNIIPCTAEYSGLLRLAMLQLLHYSLRDHISMLFSVLPMLLQYLSTYTTATLFTAPKKICIAFSVYIW